MSLKTTFFVKPFFVKETEDNLVHVYRFLLLLFKQCFVVAKRILSTASREELLCFSGLLSTRKAKKIMYSTVKKKCKRNLPK